MVFPKHRLARLTFAGSAVSRTTSLPINSILGLLIVNGWVILLTFGESSNDELVAIVDNELVVS